MQHPTREQLENFGLGRLPPQELEAIERHVGGCDSCCQTLRHCQDDTLAHLVRETGSTANLDAPAARDTTLPLELTDHPRYRVLELLGQGGMGAVYKAEHRLMERTVALKLIHRNFTSNPQAVERFKREVKLAARLAHPNIVTAHDAEQAGDVHFLVMEHVPGKSFDKLVKDKGPVSVPLACSLVRQVALGLQHAHDREMVHRDIKPHNLMVTPEGKVKILDFGLARFASESEATRHGLTAVDTMVGTPDYLAPEQARNARDVDGRADIYALGCTLYFLLAGRPPFAKGTAMEKLLMHYDTEPEPIENIRPDTPPELAALVRKMMAKKPADRVQTPAEVAQTLAPLIKSAPPRAATAEKPRRSEAAAVAPAARLTGSRRALGIGMVAAGGLLMLGVILWAVFFRSGPHGVAEKKSGGGPVVEVPRQKHVLYVLPRIGVWYGDFGPVRDILVANGVKVSVAANATGVCHLAKGSGGAPVPIDVTLSRDMDLTPYDAVIFGGMGVEEYMNEHHDAGKSARQVIKSMEKSNKIVAALCTGQRVLASAGTLQGKRAAYSKLVSHDFAKQADWRKDKRVETHDHIITGGSPDDASEFAAAILKALKNT